MNFSEVHPATAAWWAQRDTCRACAHYVRVPDRAERGRSGERCSAVRMQGMNAYCIDARLPGALCGPEATLFVLADRTEIGENSEPGDAPANSES